MPGAFGFAFNFLVRSFTRGTQRLTGTPTSRAGVDAYEEGSVQVDFDTARSEDVEQLLTLYRVVYGSSYALPLGTDRDVIAREIADPDTVWLLARERGTGRVVCSVVASIARQDRMAKLQGLVVHPDCRGSGVGDRAVSLLSDTVLAEGTEVDSAYGTARTTSTAPQRICLRNGFRPLGIFPNLRKARHHETMALLVKHREGVLDRRRPVPRIPAGLSRLVAAVDTALGTRTESDVVAEPAPPPRDEHAAAATVEIVDAPRFVLRRFHERVTDPARRFYPFHTPNMMIAEARGDFEAYTHLSRSDGYCTLIGAAPEPLAASAHLDTLISRLTELGATYLETLVPLDAFRELCVLLAHGFFPAAAYPAMRKDGERFQDYVVMARTMVPLDFQGLAIDSAFQPFAEQYIDLWTAKYLDTRGVFR
jgi:N-acetylglutamate synthase-like GNAT family acetyltransferase